MTANDWVEWEQTGRIRESAGIACDHWHRFPDDLARFQSLGLNAYRFSLEWSRFEPEPGTFDRDVLAHYQDMVDACHSRQLEPMVTLSHFTIPAWLSHRGGWLSADAVECFRVWVKTVVKSLRGVRLWCTINEPSVLAILGYLRGEWPPGHKNAAQALAVGKSLIRAHHAAHTVIKELQPQAQVGLAHHVIRFRPRRALAADRATAKMLDRLVNRWAMDRVGPRQDFIGINYYTRQWADWRQPLNPLPHLGTEPLTAMGWEIDPDGFSDLLLDAARFGKPIIVTENGIATEDDNQRIAFLNSHLQALARARQAGADVRGYFYWSGLDNFEWAEGFRPHFGLYAVDRVTQVRTERESAQVYRRYAQNGGPPALNGPSVP